MIAKSLKNARRPTNVLNKVQENGQFELEEDTEGFIVRVVMKVIITNPALAPTFPPNVIIC